MNPYETIFEHYGTTHQLLKLAEECSELSAAIVNYCNNEGWNTEAIISEMADVLVLIRQFQVASGNEIEAIVLQKVQRQLERIRLTL